VDILKGPFLKCPSGYFRDILQDPWDSLNNVHAVHIETRHLHQCPQGKLIYDWWVVNGNKFMLNAKEMSHGRFVEMALNAKEGMLNGEEMSDGRFVEMVGIIKKTIHKSLSLEMLVGGWKPSCRREVFEPWKLE
jgi:hypothetical protein